MDFEIEMARLYQQSYTTTGKLTTLRLIENSRIPYIENTESNIISISRSISKDWKPYSDSYSNYHDCSENRFQKWNSSNFESYEKINTIENNASKIKLISF